MVINRGGLTGFGWVDLGKFRVTGIRVREQAWFGLEWIGPAGLRVLGF